MTVNDAYAYGKGEVDALDARVLLAFVLNCGTNDVYIRASEELDEVELNRYLEYIAQRKGGKPVQYITKSCEFMSLPFYVTEDVLIPRPDTEALVEAVLSEFRDKEAFGLDLCAGSGNVGVSVVYYCPNVRMVLSDIDSAALTVALSNAFMNECVNRAAFILSDLFDNIHPDGYKEKFDFITANPPYIPTNDIAGLNGNVRDYEPHIALDGGADGLYFYRRIANGCKPYLRVGGRLFLEVGHNQAENVRHILMDEGFRDIIVKKDLAGVDRVVVSSLAKGMVI
jgi:release factor glutamine methyltransferase